MEQKNVTKSNAQRMINYDKQLRRAKNKIDKKYSPRKLSSPVTPGRSMVKAVFPIFLSMKVSGYVQNR